MPMLHEFLRSALEWVRELGPWTPVVFILLYIAATVLFIPGSVLTLGAGVLFGPIKGSVYVSIAATLGATAAFLISRYLARDRIARKIEGNEKFKAVDRAIGAGGWRIILLLRLSPAFPFNLLNYAAGLTEVSLRDYFFASWLGMLPGTIMYVYIGSLAGDLSRLGQGRARSPWEWTFYGLGLLATIIAAGYIARAARTELGRRLKAGEGE